MGRIYKTGLALTLFLATALGCAGPANAGMVGAPAGKAEDQGGEPGDLLFHGLSVGIEGDWMFNKDLIVSEGTDAKADFSQSYRARIGYRLWGPLEVYALVGAANLKLEATSLQTGETLTEKFGSGFLGGGGASLHFELPENYWNLLVSVDGQFTQWKGELDGFRGSTIGILTNPRGNVQARAYHAALTVGKRFAVGAEGKITPYVGGRWSQFTAQENDLITNEAEIIESGWRADNHVGVIVGISTDLTEHWQFEVEGRLVDENAISARARFRF